MTSNNIDKQTILKKLVFKIILWFFLVVILSFMTSLFLDKICEIKSLGYYDLLKNVQTNPEIIVFGSSKASTNYITTLIEQHTGKTAYNFGVGASSVLVQYSQFHEILQFYTPKLVIYDLLGHDLSDEFIKSDYEYLQKSQFPTNKNIRKARQGNDDIRWLRGILKLLKYNEIGLRIIIGSIIHPQVNDKNDGYKPRYEAKLPEILKKDGGPKQDSKPYIKNEIAADAFIDMLLEAKKNNVNMIFIRSPYYQSAKIDYNATEDPTIFDAINRYGYKYYDLSDMRINKLSDPTFYYDYLHLSDKGARAFTSQILPIILENIQN